MSPMGKLYSTSSIMTQIHSGFSHQCTVWIPFKTLHSLLTDMSRTKQLLTPDHHCLLFEDFLTLRPGTDIALLLCYNHPILNDKRTWMPIMRSVLVYNPIATRTIAGKQFFVFEEIVRSNHHADAFTNKMLTESKIERYCGLREGSAICLDIVSTHQDSRRLYTLDFFYHDFFSNIDTSQYWTIHSTRQLSLIKKSYHNISIERYSAAYIGELMGDTMQCNLQHIE